MEVLTIIWAALWEPDERFIMHRYHSSRLALAVGVAMLAGWFLYLLVAKDIVRYDLAIILVVMAITKLVAMAYLRLTH
jgi:hypothetical protein